MASFKKPFKAVPLNKKRLKGLEEFDKPLWSPPQSNPPVNWWFAAIGAFMGVCLGLAYVFATA
ncbi:hypothetical protein [Porphyrobacter sp. LM 6]|uniref:hypothetical protein n=1 Tax=Porphyrobacter sp. LM 6 TaxID=1896196 RepID=UPI0008467D81|nr:hypothetical protein [Porphyrobacter sp. LM 6]AOL93733.1 hypothetical protein BG023_11784 [Porphyrobacter sp. LM 6]